MILPDHRTEEINAYLKLSKRQDELENEIKGCKLLVYLLFTALCLLGVMLMYHTDKV